MTQLSNLQLEQIKLNELFNSVVAGPGAVLPAPVCLLPPAGRLRAHGGGAHARVDGGGRAHHA